jgi:hypothetical protein
MRFTSSLRIRNRLRAAGKWFLSLPKRDWRLSDYPVEIREHEIGPSYTGTRLKQHRYTASIVNWWVISGEGDTEWEALQELERRFAAVTVNRTKAKKSLPRPGTHVPIEFASCERISAHRELAEDFVKRVLNLDWAWISDESSLWDFHHSENNRALISKIEEVYGVDVSDIESARIAEILERIASKELSL